MKRNAFPRLLSAVLVLLGVFTSATSSRAAWREEASAYAYEKFKDFPSKRHFERESASFLATMWGGAQREIIGYTFWRPTPINLSLEGYFQKDMRVYLQVHKKRIVKEIMREGRRRELVRYEREKAPLIVFVPGVFSNADNPSARQFLNFFSSLGYHVLTVPNPWGPDYIKARPIDRVPSPELEGRVVIEATRRAIADHIGAEWVSQVHIAGESLGAAIASVAYGLDSVDGARGVFSGSATLFWPPVSLSASIKTMDRFLVGFRDRYFSDCESMTSSIYAIFRTISGGVVFDPNDKEEACAGPIVLHYGFRERLVANAKTIDKLRSDPTDTNLDKKSEEIWRRNMTFLGYIQEYSGEFYKYVERGDETNDIVTWLKQARRNGRDDIRIFSSTDDFINFESGWTGIVDNGGFQEGRDVILAPWGGHVGLTAQATFMEFLRRQFGTARHP